MVGAVLAAGQLAAPGAAEVLVAVSAADHEDPPRPRLLAARTEPREAGAATLASRGWWAGPWCHVHTAEGPPAPGVAVRGAGEGCGVSRTVEADK